MIFDFARRYFKYRVQINTEHQYIPIQFGTDTNCKAYFCCLFSSFQIKYTIRISVTGDLIFSVKLHWQRLRLSFCNET